ncbi:tyrosine-protein phosphatase [Desulfobulbus alkaliphilus]|uniref:tyrosine-protein phosphatase n=1 Tax=Desulfobulbus alkaliphilus TaxID=869814 RepID=UPI00196507EF|nr:CpsB/CapC family capsule biosynthesis tyrosine phosphatase [Desulfobulbus alkaliphilus]MBM9537387.1 hypothetical protein [Desulfobulbus alkaliphilus]
MADLSQFIDIHSHILPGLDDGPKNLAESTAMARCYAGAGIRTIIATPHYINGTAWAAQAHKVRETVNELNRHLAREQIDLQIHTGMEIAYHPKVTEYISKNLLLSLAGTTYYLIEPSFQGSQEHLLHSARTLLQAGKKIIIAHAERIDAFQRDPRPLLQLVERGLEIQVNMDSFLDKFDERCQQTAWQLLRAGGVHYLASDAHATKHRCPPTPADWDALENLLGVETLTNLCINNPRRLLAAS